MLKAHFQQRNEKAWTDLALRWRDGLAKEDGDDN
jgi:hypothetical protein